MARILVTPSGPPIYTKQPGGCGAEGDYIQMSQSFLESFNNLPAPFDNDGLFITYRHLSKILP